MGGDPGGPSAPVGGEKSGWRKGGIPAVWDADFGGLGAAATGGTLCRLGVEGPEGWVRDCDDMLFKFFQRTNQIFYNSEKQLSGST